MTATVTGAVTGAVGAVGGAIGGATAILASTGVGVISGVTTAINTDGTVSEKVVTGLTSGIIACAGTYLGTKIPVATDDVFTTGFTSFSGGLYMGAQTEIVNVAAQQVVSYIFTNQQKTNSTRTSSTSFRSQFYGQRMSVAY